MADRNSALGWTAEQWDKVNGAIAASFANASVASELFEGDCYGPLAPSEEYVRLVSVQADKEQKVTIEDDQTIKLFNLTVHVELSNEQVSDPNLANALLAFRRAANLLAQTEDFIVFNGFEPDKKETSAPAGESSAGEADKKKKSAAAAERTADEAARRKIIVSKPTIPVEGLAGIADLSAKGGRAATGDSGQQLVNTIVNAIQQLEDDSHTEPFACVLGNELFAVATTPSNSMVMPADRIKELLRARTGSGQSSHRGLLLRSGQLPPTTGMVLSRADNEIDIVVGTPPTAQLLQVTQEARYFFRVYEKFMIRVKDPNAGRRFVLAV